KKELEDAYAFTYFYRVTNKVVGYFKLNINEAQTETIRSDYLEIQRIYYRPCSQGSGKVTQVFNFAIKTTQELNKSKIRSGIWEYNEQALNFYKKQGLKITGSHKFYTGAVVDTDLIMEKSI